MVQLWHFLRIIVESHSANVTKKGTMLFLKHRTIARYNFTISIDTYGHSVEGLMVTFHSAETAQTSGTGRADQEQKPIKCALGSLNMMHVRQAQMPVTVAPHHLCH